jgi:hypothetical protein
MDIQPRHGFIQLVALHPEIADGGRQIHVDKA